MTKIAMIPRSIESIIKMCDSCIGFHKIPGTKHKIPTSKEKNLGIAKE